MNYQLFEQTLSAHVHRQPFIPFAVNLADGRRIVIEEPAVVFNGHRVGYLSPADDLIDFAYEQVQSMEVLNPELQV